MDGWFALLQRCPAHDTPELPPPCRVQHGHRFSWPGYVQRAWTVRDDGRVATAPACWPMPSRTRGTPGGLSSHRGRRLGLRMKLANLDLLVREHPEVRTIDTFNADDNRWVIAVNEAMGFLPVQHIEDYELDLGPRTQAGTAPAISAAASGP